MDHHQTYGTSFAIAKALQAHVVDGFCYNGTDEPVGLICEISETTTSVLEQHLQEMFEIPYIDFEGKDTKQLRKLPLLLDVVIKLIY